jgi:hypothetical protein
MEVSQAEIRSSSDRFARLGFGYVALARVLLGLSAAVTALATLSCGIPTAILDISAPSSAVAGSPLTVTVTVTLNGRPDRIFNGLVHFTSSDSAAVLPADYLYSATDAGSHTFSNGVTLITAGSQSIKATDVFAPAITATANVTVSAATTATIVKVKDSAPASKDDLRAYLPPVSHATSVSRVAQIR